MDFKVSVDGKPVKASGFEGSSLGQLLSFMGMSPVSVVLVRNGKLCLPDEKISGGDTVEILTAASGG